MFQEVITRSAAGRQVSLGDMYDLRTDEASSSTIFTRLPMGDIVQTTQTNKLSVIKTKTDELSELFETLHIDPEVGVNLVSGKLKPFGHIHGLFAERKAPLRETLVVTYKSCCERLNTTNQDLRTLLNLSSLKNEKLRHVVVGVEYGGRAVVHLHSAQQDGGQQERSLMKADGRVDLEVLKQIIEPKGSFTLFSDTSLPSTPESAGDVVSFVSDFPLFVKKINNSKGKALSVTLMPVPTFLNDLKYHDVEKPLVVRLVPHAHFSNLLLHFDRASALTSTMVNMVSILKEFDELKAQELERTLNKYRENLQQWKHILSTLVSDLKSVSQPQKNIGLFMHNTERELLLKQANYSVNKFRPLLEKAKTLNYLKSKGARMILGQLLESKLEKSSTEVLVLHYSDQVRVIDPELFFSTLQFFLECIESKKGVEWYVVDQQRSEDVLPVMVIKSYHTGKVVSEDLLYDTTLSNCQNIAECTQPRKANTQPEQRALLTVPCPLECSSSQRQWRCKSCGTLLEFDFVEDLLCKCGAAPYVSFLFKCSHASHVDFMTAGRLQILQQIMKQPKELNILVVGSVHAGKTTLVQSILSYLRFKSLQDAEDSGLDVKRPQSTTCVRAWTLRHGDMNLKLIDTPGLSHSFTRDKTSLQNIVNYLRGVPSIHGICIMTNDDYSLQVFQQILPQSALKNVVKCSGTNADYKFHNTWMEYLNNLPDTKLEDLQLRRYQDDWTHSTLETLALISRLKSLSAVPAAQVVALHDSRNLVPILNEPYTRLEVENMSLTDTNNYTGLFEHEVERLRVEFELKKRQKEEEVKAAKLFLQMAAQNCKQNAIRFENEHFDQFANKLIQEAIKDATDKGLGSADSETVQQRETLRKEQQSHREVLSRWASSASEDLPLKSIELNIPALPSFTPEVSKYFAENRKVFVKTEPVPKVLACPGWFNKMLQE